VLNTQGGELPKDPNAIPTGGLPAMPDSFDKFKAEFNAKRLLYIKCN
jgi:hypothetical protein